MDKKFILQHLKIEHLREHPSLLEIAETSGLEVVKELLTNHEQTNFYIPRISSIEGLLRDFVDLNKSTMSEHELRKRSDLSKKTIQKFLRTHTKK